MLIPGFDLVHFLQKGKILLDIVFWDHQAFSLRLDFVYLTLRFYMSWNICRRGLSPLVEGQWKPFLAVYAGFYIFHNIVRPARFALSVALGPKFDRLLAWVQNRFRVNKGVAILMVMLSLNVVCSCGGMCAGIFLVSKMTGVPHLSGQVAPVVVAV